MKSTNSTITNAVERTDTLLEANPQTIRITFSPVVKPDCIHCKGALKSWAHTGRLANPVFIIKMRSEKPHAVSFGVSEATRIQ